MADERIEVESIIGEITLAGDNISRPKLYASKLTDIWRMKKNIHHKELFGELLRDLEASKGDPKTQEELINAGYTLLHGAVISNNYDKVQNLLNAQEHLLTVNNKTIFGETALYFASYIGSMTIVLLLLENGAQVTTDIMSEESELLGAVRTDQTLVAEILLTNGSNIDVMCEDWAAIHVACFNKTFSMIRLLIEGGANVNLIGDWSYAPINMIFVEFSKREQYLQPCNDEWLVKRCLSELLKAGNVDVNYWSRCALGNPPVLTKALIMLSPTIFRMLINHGAHILQLTEYSQRSMHDELVMFSIRKTNLEGSHSEGFLPKHSYHRGVKFLQEEKPYCAGFGLTDRVERYCDCLELMINHGVEPEATDLATISRILLRQLRYVPLTKAQPEMEPVFRVLIDYSSKAISLKAMCRRVIRVAMGAPVKPKIMSIVGLAPKLKSYLLLEDIGSDNLYSI